jgi:hypothetical protein
MTVLICNVGAIGVALGKTVVYIGTWTLAASTALPVATQDTQRAIAVAVLTSSRVLASMAEGSPRKPEIDAAEVLAKAPLAASWAARFSHGDVPSVRAFRRHAAPHAVHLSAEAIAEGAPSDADRMLIGLLEQAIERFPVWAGTAQAAPDAPATAPTSTTA